MKKVGFLALAESRYDALREPNKGKVNFYDLEVEFAKLWRELGREVLEKSIGPAPLEERKKKTMKTSFGDLDIAYTNPLSKKVNGFHISPRLQEIMVLYGETDCYAEAPEMLQQTLGISVSTSQVYRVTDTYGAELKKREEDKRLLPLLTKDEILYMGFDGSFIFSREEGWKEVKVGRLFKSTDCVRGDEKRNCIMNSQYMAHLCDHHTFIGHADKLIESFGPLDNRLVCISDGAPWIRNWIGDSYPNTV